MKYKVGDAVRIKSFEECKGDRPLSSDRGFMHDGFRFNGLMRQYCGGIYIIDGVSPYSYTLEGLHMGDTEFKWQWKEVWLEEAIRYTNECHNNISCVLSSIHVI